MSRTDELLEDLDYLERKGMTVEQLRALHHWGGRAEAEKRVTYASARDYFSHGREMRGNNAAFAGRVHLVADLHRRGMPAFVEVALRSYPLAAA